MSLIRTLIREAHRRSMWQVLGLYAVASWVIYQVVLALWEGLGLPSWLPGTALVLLLIGLPIVLATAFVQEGTPGGERGGDDPVAGTGHGHLAGLETSADTVVVGRREGEAEGRGENTAAAAAAGPASGRTAPPARGSALFTWPRAITGGVLAFAALGLASAGFMGMRTLGIGPAGTLIAKGVLTEQSRILVAEFSAPAQDSLLAAAVAEALRIDLPLSDVVRVVDPAEVGSALRRMGLEPTELLTERVARHLAEREGIASVLVGELVPLGSRYQLSARLLTPDSGHVLLRVREVAESADDVLSAVDRLSSKIRERAGESLKSVRASPPLAETTTSSLEALKLFTQAQAAADLRNDNRAAARLLEEALEQDSTFAMAWRKLATVLTNMGEDRDRQVEAYTKAVAYSDRLPEWERLRALASYYTYVEGDDQRAIETYQRLIEVRPDHWGSHNNLGIAYTRLGEFERAEEALRLAVEADSTALSLGNLAATRISTGDLGGARTVLDARRRLFPDNETNLFGEVTVLYAEGDVAGAERRARSGIEEASRPFRPVLLGQLADLLARGGRLDEGRRLRDQAAEIGRDLGLPAAELNNVASQAWTDIFVTGRARDAARRLDAIARAESLGGLDPLDRPYLLLAGGLGAAGEPDRARALLDEWREVTPEGLRRREDRMRMWAEGLILLAEGATEAGLDLLRRSTRGTDGVVVTLPTLAWAYDVAGRPDAALAAYQEFERLQHPGRIFADAFFLALAYERMAQLHEDRGDRARAAEYHQKFVELWSEADAELQPRVDAARRALERLVRER